MNMFKNLGNMAGLFKQAQEMQTKIATLQGDLEQQNVEGIAGGGLVKVTMTARGAVVAVFIDPSLMKSDEKDMLEDLVVAAVNDGRAKGESIAADEMQKITGGLQLPAGMKLPF